MSRYNRKGYGTLLMQDEHGNVRHFPVRKGGVLDKKNARMMKKFKKARRAHFNEYKRKLKEIKKRVPLAERSKIGPGAFPTEFLE